MRRAAIISLSVLLLFTVLYSCSKSSSDGGTTPTDPCAGVTITVAATITNASSGSNNGNIIATATGSTGLNYSLNGGTFQSSGTFSNLAAGTYTIVAKNSNGCSGTAQFTVGTTNSCGSVTISVNPTTVTATPCNNGSINVTATGSTGFTYSLNGGTFQAGNSFTNLTGGNYTITVKDANGCTQTANATINTAAAGPLFSAVKTIVQTNCALSGCHSGASPQNGIDFSDQCQIIAQKDRVKARAVDGNPSIMPPSPNPQLSTADKQKIVDWINAGGSYTN